MSKSGAHAPVSHVTCETCRYTRPAESAAQALELAKEHTGWYSDHVAMVVTDDGASIVRREQAGWQVLDRRMKLRQGIALVALALGLAAGSASAHLRERHFHDYPVIGTPAYDASCIITRENEDHSAFAFCPEDGALYYFDADGASQLHHLRPTWGQAPFTWAPIAAPSKP